MGTVSGASCGYVTALFFIASCGTAGKPASRDTSTSFERNPNGSSSEGWYVLQISRVQVQPTKIDHSTWDGQEEHGGNGCGIVGMIGKSAGGPIGGAVATFLCEESSNKQEQRDPRAPDLFVQLAAGPMKYRTPIAVDTFGEVFDYPLVVPVDGIGAAGLEIQVLDQDDDVGSGELIGMVRVSANEIAAATKKTPPLLSLRDSQVAQLEVAVLPYSPPAKQQLVDFDVSEAPRMLNIRARAGELVHISATGTYSVADNGDKITPRGYENGDKRTWNLKGFETMNHASAIALIGAVDETHSSLEVGDCVATLAPVAGAI